MSCPTVLNRARNKNRHSCLVLDYLNKSALARQAHATHPSPWHTHTRLRLYLSHFTHSQLVLDDNTRNKRKKRDKQERDRPVVRFALTSFVHFTPLLSPHTHTHKHSAFQLLAFSAYLPSCITNKHTCCRCLFCVFPWWQRSSPCKLQLFHLFLFPNTLDPSFLPFNCLPSFIALSSLLFSTSKCLQLKTYKLDQVVNMSDMRKKTPRKSWKWAWTDSEESCSCSRLSQPIKINPHPQRGVHTRQDKRNEMCVRKVFVLVLWK